MNQPISSPLDSGFERPSRVRYVVLLALAMAAVISYLSRVALAPAASTIQAEMGLDDREMGYVLGGFFLGYLWAQVPGGWLGDRLGARRGLALLSMLWSVATIGTALADSATALWWTRAAVGFAQGGLFPISAKVITAWFPVDRRGIAGAVPTACMSVGSVLASGLTVVLIPAIGWRGVFHGYAVLGIVWAVVFALWYRNTPQEHQGTNQAERDLILGHQGSGAGGVNGNHERGYNAEETAIQDRDISTGTALARMAIRPGMWAFCGQSLFRAFGYAFFITWFPAYLERSRGLQLKDAGMLTMGPLFGVVVGSFLGGYLVDMILKRTGNCWLSRSGLSAGALLVCSLTMLAATLIRDPMGAVLLITVGTLFFGITGPTTWATTMDIAGSHTAIVFAVMNMAGNFGAMACPVVVGYLFEEIQESGANWELVLYLFSVVYLAGAVCWLVLDPRRSVVNRAWRKTN
ncbi:MFS transporter [Tautonia rosea]|uniref:MFS transporter n=1 Tax=Tautonia rosea TaxID=2728037 RepID=UPI0014759DA8|nr:MFS transporter [Tautonia rosea]